MTLLLEAHLHATTIELPVITIAATPAIASCGPTDLFDGIADLPDLDEVFHERGLEIIRREGVGRFALDGGLLAPDARLTFGSPSPIAFELLHEIASGPGGFRFTDAVGDSWAVSLTGDASSGWCGLGVGFQGDVRLLDRRFRHRMIGQLDRQLAVPRRPGRMFADGETLRRHRLARLHRTAALLDLGLGLLPTIMAAASETADGEVDFTAVDLADQVWGSDPFERPSDWGQELLNSLAAVGRIECIELLLPCTGWRPSIVAREPAFARVDFRDAATIHIQVGERFLDFWHTQPHQHIAA